MKFYNWIGKVEAAIAKYSLLVMTVLVFVSAMSRKFGHPLSWTVDVSTFLFAWAVFLGVDASMRQTEMVSVDIFVTKLPKKTQWQIKIFNNVIISMFLIMMVIYGTRLTVSTYFRTFSGLPWLSYSWVTVAVPLGCLLMLVTTILQTRDLIKRRWTA